MKKELFVANFDQEGQVVWNAQRNVGRDINNNIPFKVARARIPPVTLPPRAQFFVVQDENLPWLSQQFHSEVDMTITVGGPDSRGTTTFATEAFHQSVAQPHWLMRFLGDIFYYSFYMFSSLAVAFEELACLFEEDFRADPHHAALHILNCRRTILPWFLMVWKFFVYFGKCDRFVTNKLDEQEIATLSLNLLQICWVCVNTLQIQCMLAEAQQFRQMKKEDLRALPPLIFSHPISYGQFHLGLFKRMPTDETLSAERWKNETLLNNIFSGVVRRLNN
jgi:hypothetical protein